jgi:hypothetical protein
MSKKVFGKKNDEAVVAINRMADKLSSCLSSVDKPKNKYPKGYVESVARRFPWDSKIMDAVSHAKSKDEFYAHLYGSWNGMVKKNNHFGMPAMSRCLDFSELEARVYSQHLAERKYMHNDIKVPAVKFSESEPKMVKNYSANKGFVLVCPESKRQHPNVYSDFQKAEVVAKELAEETGGTWYVANIVAAYYDCDTVTTQTRTETIECKERKVMRLPLTN